MSIPPMASLISLRNSLIHFCYKHILKPVLFKIDPEKVHNGFLFLGKILGSNPFTRQIIKTCFSFSDPCLKQTLCGISFPNPIGLAAGFDKNAEITNILPEVGFGFIEIGSITGEFCEGNQKPRLWRHPEKQSLRVYYGLKNSGSEQIAKRLSQKSFNIPVGTSIAMTNCQKTAEDLQAAIEDYAKAYKALNKIGSYTTINISCPNANGGQPFVEPEKLEKLLQKINTLEKTKPIFLKLSPDISFECLDELTTIADSYHIDGFICSNLVKKHDLGKGGISGKPVAEISLKQIQFLQKKFQGKKILIACGGVFSAEDAYKRIKAGAHLIQLITGMIFEGPQLIGQINQELVACLKKDGLQQIEQAIGKQL